MSIGTMEKYEQTQEGGISISNLSENDKGEVLRYLSGENYMQRGGIKTDSIANPREFFEKLNQVSSEEKQKIQNKLKAYFKDKENIRKDNIGMEGLKQKEIQLDQVKQLMLKLNLNLKGNVAEIIKKIQSSIRERYSDGDKIKVFEEALDYLSKPQGRIASKPVYHSTGSYGFVKILKHGSLDARRNSVTGEQAGGNEKKYKNSLVIDGYAQSDTIKYYYARKNEKRSVLLLDKKEITGRGIDELDSKLLLNNLTEEERKMVDKFARNWLHMKDSDNLEKTLDDGIKTLKNQKYYFNVEDVEKDIKDNNISDDFRKKREEQLNTYNEESDEMKKELIDPFPVILTYEGENLSEKDLTTIDSCIISERKTEQPLENKLLKEIQVPKVKINIVKQWIQKRIKELPTGSEERKPLENITIIPLEYFEAKEIIKDIDVNGLDNKKNDQKETQNNQIDELEGKINESIDKELNIEQLKEGGKELTTIIDEITSLGIQGIGTTEDDKKKQIDKFLQQIEDKDISNEYKERIKQFIQKSLNKMYTIKNTYLEGGNISTEKVQNLLYNIMGITDKQSKSELSRFIEETGLKLQVELKGPSLVFYIPRKIKKILGDKIIHSTYGFAIIETQGKINNKEMYNKIAQKYLGFGGIKCTDDQVHFEDLKGSVVIINAGKGQFRSTEQVGEHEYQHILNTGYLMPKKGNASEIGIRLAQGYLIPIDTAIDELLAGMGIENLTNELGLYNFYLEEIKNKEYDQTTPTVEVLENLKKDPQKHEEYKKKREEHKENVTTYYNYFTEIMEKTGLDRKTTANMLAGEAIEKRKDIAETK